MTHPFQFPLYQAAEENVSIRALVRDDTVWLTRRAMAELFDCSPADK